MSTSLDRLRREPPVAYFSMEIALRDELPTYSGGLGVLAGDVVRTAADLGLPFLAVTQLSRKGYFRQVLDADGRQVERPATFAPEDHLERLDVKASLRLEGREVAVGAWLCDCVSPLGRAVPVLFLDTDLPENAPEDRAITDALYGGDARHRLKQEAVLGIAGARILAALGVWPRKYHVNEGHSALLVVELFRNATGLSHEARLREVRERCVFTTHTPVEAGHDKFDHALVADVLGDLAPLPLIERLAGAGKLNMTLLALSGSGYVNGVAERHREISTAMFPGHRISAITNGVHSFTWTAPSIRRVLDAHLPGWAAEPLLLARVETIPDAAMWAAHLEAKRDLCELVARKTGVQLSPDVLTVGFARRFTPYKRPHLLFTDLARLRRTTRRGPLQVVFAGKAHPADLAGKQLIAEIVRAARELEGVVRVAFIPDYDMAIARRLVAGVDVWLNTPEPPMEASGTSGMKAAHNGVLNFSVLDGWWIEGHHEGVTGWSIGPAPKDAFDARTRAELELDDLYGKLEYVILPTYYQRPEDWVRMVKASIDDLASYFNTHRMLRRYVTDAYFPRGE